MADRVPEQDGLTVARRVARWYLGYPSWADRIIDAYLNPERVQKELELEMGDD